MEKQVTSEWKSWAWSPPISDNICGMELSYLGCGEVRYQYPIPAVIHKQDSGTRFHHETYPEWQPIQRQQQLLVPLLNHAPKHMLSCDWCPWCPGARSSCRSRKLTIVLNARCHCRTYCCMHEKTCLSIPCSVTIYKCFKIFHSRVPHVLKDSFVGR